ncbi:MAG: 50S ribosomal protein L25 [Candidatus Omnitrophota bacterium]
MEKIKLNATMRTDLGKSGSKHLRKNGLIPAIVYKAGKQGLNVQIDNKELWKALHTEAGGNAIINMDILKDEKRVKKTVIVQDLQIDPVNDKVMHVDFHEISLKEKLKVKIPVNIKGEGVGVKEQEGVLTQVLWEIEVECLPTAIPEHIDVHIDELHIGEAIHIKDMTFSQEIAVLEEPDQVVVSVSVPEAEIEEEEEISTEEGAEPEVIKKGKKEEEGAGEEGAGQKEEKTKKEE